MSSINLEDDLRDLQNRINQISMANMHAGPLIGSYPLTSFLEERRRFLMAADCVVDTDNEVSIKVNRKHKVVFNFKN